MSYLHLVLFEELLIDEGFRDDDRDGLYEVYIDTEGYKTVGIGHRTKIYEPEHEMEPGEEISYSRVIELFESDIEQAILDCNIVFNNFDSLPFEVQAIFGNMMFNLGRTRFSKFKRMIAAARREYWHEVAGEMADSKWAREDVPNRANRLIKRMKKVL
tara:strand:- start:69 stop:542 length:474 start_codon:yes stop_codon:yes gene_type:complete